MAQFAEITRDERIDRGNVRGGNSNVLAGQHEKKMLQIVFGENRDGAVFGQAAIEESLADAADCLQHLRVGELAPFAVRFPFGYADFVRRDFHPVDEAIGEDFRVRSQGFVRTNQDRAIGEMMKSCAGSSQAHRADAIV